MAEPRYIDANKVAMKIDTRFDENLEILVPLSDVRKALLMTPTEDVVKVVRCKNCRHKNPNGSKCLRDNLWHDSEDYCSYGERREDTWENT